jgi:C1A family cysteine protease
MPRKAGRYGWIPDLPDHRDRLYAAPPPVVMALPVRVDLRPACPPVVDQGQLGSCTANAIGNAHRFEQRKQGDRGEFLPSRLFIYYNERVIEHSVASDAGAQLRDGIKTIAHEGVCPELMWPYVIAKFAVKPAAACYTAAREHQAISYLRVTQSLTQCKGCLAAGYPFVVGFAVYESFESPAVAKTGVVPMPGPGESALGGHAVLAVGYDDRAQRFLLMNSWGTRWGQQGFFTMPYAYLLDDGLAQDFWTIRLVEV